MAKLRAVGADEVAEPTVQKSVTAAAAAGSRRELLVSVRDRVAIAVEDASTPAREYVGK